MGRKMLKKLPLNSNSGDVFEPQLFSSLESLVLITNNYPGDKCWQYLAANWLQFTALIVWSQVYICLGSEGKREDIASQKCSA